MKDYTGDIEAICLNHSCPIPRDQSIEECAQHCSNATKCGSFNHFNIDRTSTCNLYIYPNDVTQISKPKKQRRTCGLRLGDNCCRKGINTIYLQYGDTYILRFGKCIKHYFKITLSSSPIFSGTVQ